MAGPFPGMDPYLEWQGAWRDFHNALIAELRNELGVRLPDNYVARLDERIEVASQGGSPPRSFLPDVLVAREPARAAGTGVAVVDAPIATIEPELMEVSDRDPEEVKITWVEVRALPDLELVTAIEVLSPINKAWQGRKTYLDKREKLHASRVNLVEIDLLLGGAPLPMKQRIEPGAYYAIVARGPRLPVAEVYRWTVRDPLPRLPIPLREPDPDILIDLAALVTRVYDLGRYARTLRHEPPLPETAPLAPEDRAWVESLVGRRAMARKSPRGDHLRQSHHPPIAATCATTTRANFLLKLGLAVLCRSMNIATAAAGEPPSSERPSRTDSRTRRASRPACRLSQAKAAQVAVPIAPR